MSDLSDDELTVLMIANAGESMMAIARWKQPTESLIAKGYLQSRGGDNFNCLITEAGRAACKEAEDAPYKTMIETGSKIGATQKAIRDFAEQAAQLLAKAAQASHQAVGDAPEYAAEQWSGVILRRALEILRGLPGDSHG
jgi:hypothetical protein